MSVTVSEQTILDALHQVSPDRWGDVLAFIESLRAVNEPTQETGKLPLDRRRSPRVRPGRALVGSNGHRG